MLEAVAHLYKSRIQPSKYRFRRILQDFLLKIDSLAISYMIYKIFKYYPHYSFILPSTAKILKATQYLYIYESVSSNSRLKSKLNHPVRRHAQEQVVSSS